MNNYCEHHVTEGYCLDCLRVQRDALADALRAMSAIWDCATMTHNSREISKAMGHDNYRAMFDAWAKARAALGRGE